jgi:hypothetical protein
MGLRRKRRNVEGWDDPLVEVGRLAKLKESIRDSNRAWLIVMIGVILIGICLALVVAKNEQLRVVKVPAPPQRTDGVYDDEAHRKFVREFDDSMLKRGIPAKATFVNSGEVKVVVLIDSTEDDIVFVSSTAARAILRRFHNAPIVYVYTQDDADPPHEKQVAKTQWVTLRNDFVVLMTRAPAGAEQ